MYLRIIASQFASGAGMARKDSEDVVRAIADICQHSSRTEASTITVSFSVSGASVIAEMRGFSANFEASRITAPRGLEAACRFVDGVEVVREEDGDMVRLTKYVNRPVNPTAISIPSVSRLSGSGIHG